MKNLRFLTMTLLASGLMFLTSCEDDNEDPLGPAFTEFMETNVGITDGAIDATPGQTLRFEWVIRSGDADLEEFTIRLDGVDLANAMTEGGNDIPYENIPSSENNNYSDAIELVAPTTAGTYDYLFIVTDEDGLRETREVEVTVAGATTDLTTAASFTWQRMGGAAGTGLDQFGLQWTNNTSTSAIVTKDAATTMVDLGSAAWTNITTVEGLMAAIQAGTAITEYDNVSVTADGTYDDVLGVIYNNKVYMLHITNATVTSGTGGTDVTIDGEFKAEP